MYLQAESLSWHGHLFNSFDVILHRLVIFIPNKSVVDIAVPGEGPGGGGELLLVVVDVAGLSQGDLPITSRVIAKVLILFSPSNFHRNNCINSSSFVTRIL